MYRICPNACKKFEKEAGHRGNGVARAVNVVLNRVLQFSFVIAHLNRPHQTFSGSPPSFWFFDTKFPKSNSFSIMIATSIWVRPQGNSNDYQEIPSCNISVIT
ncbi:hypothetical protein L6452_22083 [Arctium lappa]|uniref:Uncharacterized protein n=1 Tax=Arctium lappa TaxID=4217 RepID=A0ACB9AYU3_ARCLA|nr:hypothetical protein L6452_22083 [Arctium lappa]